MYGCEPEFIRKQEQQRPKGKYTLAEAIKIQEEVYQRLMAEIEAGRQAEADYWRFLDSEDEEGEEHE